MNKKMISEIVESITNGKMAQVQLGAWLMACQINGLNDQETADLTEKMTNSGDVLERGDNRVDKHSTGGVGDKMSLILAPALKAAGLSVPMLAGRGLAHTGGTIDKLESIPGFNTSLSLGEMNSNPCFISQQTRDIAPVDRIMYAARDVTATVPCVGLITASIISKKAAEGIKCLVLDVKCGKAAFMQSIVDARNLAKSMIKAGTKLGMRVVVQITEMDTPIGKMVGNSHEIVEVIDCLKGSGPEDTMELVYMQANALGVEIKKHIHDGTALEEFKQMCIRQNVDRDIAQQLIEEPWSILSRGAFKKTVDAHKSGYVTSIDALRIGELLCSLGAGRRTPSDKINHSIGLELVCEIGTYVMRGDPLMYLDLENENLELSLNDLITIEEEIPKKTGRLIETIYPE